MSKFELLHFPTKPVFSSPFMAVIFSSSLLSFSTFLPSANYVRSTCRILLEPNRLSPPSCYHPGPSHLHLKPGFSQPVSLLPPCPSPIIYPKLGNQSDVFKHKSCPVTPQLQSLQYLSLTLRTKSFLQPRRPHLTWGLPTSPASASVLPQFTPCHTL